MGFRINLALPLAGIFVLAACQQQEARQPIQRTRDKTGMVQAQQDSDCKFTRTERRLQKSKVTDNEISSADCLHVPALIACLEKAGNEMARVTTTDLKLFERGTDLRTLNPVTESKALIQLLNQGAVELKNESGRMAKVRPLIAELNGMIGQANCEGVAINGDESGRIYKIESKNLDHIQMKLSNPADSTPKWLTIRASNTGRIIVQRTRPIEATICNETGKQYHLRETIELTFGAQATTGNRIAKDLVQLIADSISVSENINKSLKKGGDDKKDQTKITSREESVAVDALAIADAYSMVKPGRFDKIICDKPKFKSN